MTRVEYDQLITNDDDHIRTLLTSKYGVYNPMSSDIVDLFSFMCNDIQRLRKQCLITK